ncbi:MAG: hypothetical protein ABSC32_10575 [Steroidobacteraceae bacterium]
MSCSSAVSGQKIGGLLLSVPAKIRSERATGVQQHSRRSQQTNQ